MVEIFLTGFEIWWRPVSYTHLDVYKRQVADYQKYICIFVMWYNGQDSDDDKKIQFYYHPDHLGSSSYITNLDGEVVQHIEYVPFGEVFIEERNDVWNTPYLFNACLLYTSRCV